MAGILQSIYSSLTALLHPRQPAEPGKGFLSHWHKSQEIWAVQNIKSRAGPSPQPSLCWHMEEEVQTSGDPSNCLMWFPREVSASLWTATGKHLHQTMLAWHIMEKVKNDSSWICFLCLWASWQMHRNNHVYQKEHHFAMDVANHTRDSSLLILLWRGNNFLCFNSKLISKSPITKMYLPADFCLEKYSTLIT